jgi:hypothetical protein
MTDRAGLSRGQSRAETQNRERCAEQSGHVGSPGKTLLCLRVTALVALTAGDFT